MALLLLKPYRELNFLHSFCNFWIAKIWYDFFRFNVRVSMTMTMPMIIICLLALVFSNFGLSIAHINQLRIIS